MIKIYLIINLINNKKYVGQTCQTVKQRWSDHLQTDRTKNSFPLYHAIKKYGKDNFVISEIDYTEDIDEANRKEIYWGLFYDTLSPQGYSLRLGGRKTIHLSEEIKNRIRISNTGKKISEEAKAKLKLARNKRTLPPEAYIKQQETLKRTYPNHYRDIAKKAWEVIRASGRKQTTTDKSHWQTESFRKKCSENQTKRANEIGRLFICNETKKTFRNTGECARQMNLKSYKCVWKCLNNKSKSYGGFTFTYLE
jgi:group I intron endonuclease